MRRYLTRSFKPLKDPQDVKTCEQHQDAEVAFMGIPWDGAVAGRPGSRFAPQKIRAAFCNTPFRTAVEDVGDVDVVVGDADETWRRIEEASRELSRYRQILVAGGDHSVTPYVYKGLAEGDVGYIVLDAHLDLRTTSEGLTSGISTRLIREFRQNAAITVIGVRKWSNPSYMFKLADKLGVTYVTIEELQQKGVDEIAEMVVERHENTRVYISVDLDVVDPAYAPGVNAPSPGGMTSREVLTLVEKLSQKLKPIVVDVVEVSPPYDINDVTSQLAATILYVAIWR